jgi:hypothetical protein
MTECAAFYYVCRNLGGQEAQRGHTHGRGTEAVGGRRLAHQFVKKRTGWESMRYSGVFVLVGAERLSAKRACQEMALGGSFGI